VDGGSIENHIIEGFGFGNIFNLICFESYNLISLL